METIKARSALLCNQEVMVILQKLKEEALKKHKREGALATITYEILHYLNDTDCKSQDSQNIQNFLLAIKKFKLTKMEKLMMVNNPPRNELDIQLMIHESEERLSEEAVQNILDSAKEFLLKSS